MRYNKAGIEGNLSHGQSRRIFLERFGISLETSGFNVYRILNLAMSATNAIAVGFVVPIQDRFDFIALAGLTIDEVANASPGCQITVRDGRHTVQQNINAGEWCKECPSLQSTSINNYIGLPVYSSRREVIGALSLFFDNNWPIPSEELFEILNDYCRLIEDCLALHALSILDPLTGLFNRRYLEQQTHIEWRRALRLQVPFTVVMLDVDHFKLFNDSAGHLAGDRVLIKLGAAINDVCSRASDSAYRYGGEEFAMILPMTTGTDAEALIERLRSKFTQLNISHPAFENKLVTFTAGITTKKSLEELKSIDIDTCFREADEALYAAKNQGRNKTLHYKSL
jgi:diguanylate cyclase (GGDEF)-like protein